MSTSGSTGTGLRERKKRRTRQAIQHHALRLFAEHGYEATTVEQIAAAAEVSPSTFFRYYPTKEDVVLTDEFDPLIVAAVLDRPAGETPVQALHEALMGMAPQMMADGGQETLERMRLVMAVPALRARLFESTGDTVRRAAKALAGRAGRATPGYEDDAVAAAYIGMAAAAILHWAEHGDDPGELLERGYAAVRAAFGS